MTWYIPGQIAVAILLFLLNGRHLLADAAQSPSSGSLSTGRLVFEAAVLPVRRTVANRMLRLEIALLATPRKAGCDEGGVLPRAGGWRTESRGEWSWCKGADAAAVDEE